jgi:formate hydrogenlyase subunit 6/NADH:ubiquinone oxidoreductase subunit I
MKNPGRMTNVLVKSAFKKPATVLYPHVKAVKPANFRGKIVFIPEKCIGCKLCMRDCPSEAIKIIKVGDKKFEAEFNLGRCLYCAQCVDSCNKEALAVSNEFELAVLDPEKFIIRYKNTSEN